MAFFNFPPNPNIGDTYTVGSKTYVWNGYAWTLQATFQATSITVDTITVTSSTNSTATTNGAAVIAGGLGVGRDITVGGSAYIAGDLYVDGTQTVVNTVQIQTGDKNLVLSTSATSALMAINSGIEVGPASSPYITWLYDGVGNWVSSGGVIVDTTASILSNLNATTVTNGALVVKGGVGIGGALYVGGNMYSGGYQVITTANFSSTGVTSVNAGPGISVNHPTGDVIVSNTGVLAIITGSDVTINQPNGYVTLGVTSTLQTVTKRGNSTDQIIYITTTTDSFNTTTGALVVTGGAGFGGTVNIGGSLGVIGIVNASQLYEGGVNRVLTSATIVAGTGLSGGGTITGPGGTVTLTNAGVTSLVASTDLSVSGSTGDITISNTSTLQSVTGRGNVTTNAIGITNLTQSNTPTGGALVVAGGIGVGKDLRVAGTMYQQGNLVIDAVNIFSHAVTSLVASPGLYVDQNQGDITISNYGVLDLSSDGYIGLSNNTGSIYITNLGVQSVTAGVDMSVSANTGTITIDNTSTLQSVTYRGGTTNNAIAITNQTYSASTSNSQALLVSGGIGALMVTASVIFDNGNRVLTNVVPTAGYGIDVTSYTVNGTTASFTIDNLGVTSLTAGTDTAVTANTGDVVVFTTSTLQSVTNRGNATSNAIEIDNISFSSSTIAGNALVVAGGIGAQTLYVAGTIYTNGQAVATTESISTNSVSAIYTGPGISVDNHTGTVTVSNTGVIAIVAGTDVSIDYTGTYPGSGVVTINDTSTFRSVTYKGSTTPYSLSITSSTNATSTTTGALVITGGLGVGRDIWARSMWSNGAQVVTTATLGNLGVSSITAGSGISVSAPTGDITITNTGVTQLNGSTYIGVNNQTGNIIIYNLGVQTLTAGDDLAVSSNTGTVTVSSTATLQSVTNRGSVTSNAISITNVTQSTTMTNGALTVAGGAGISKNLNVGGNSTIYGNLTVVGNASFIGTSTYVSSTNTYYTDNLVDLHVPPSGPMGMWTTDDGLDIGFKMHYYKSGLSDNAALVRDNASGELHWYGSGASSTTTFAASNLGAFRAGTLYASGGVNATTTNSGDLQVSGGAGIGQDLYVGGNAYIGGQAVITTASISSYAATSIAGGNSGIYVTTSNGVVSIFNYGVNSIQGTTYLGVSASTGSVLLTNLGVQQITTGSGIVVSQSTGTVNIQSIDTLQLVTQRGQTTNQVITLTNGANDPVSTSSNQTLIVQGGIGALSVAASGLFDNGNRVITSVTVTAGNGLGGGGTITGPTGAVTLTNMGVTSLASGTDITLSATTGSITVNDVSTLQSVTGRGATTNNALTVSNNSLGTTTSTGNALTIAGSIGALRVNATNVFDNGVRVITNVTPVAGTAITISSVSTSNGTMSFTVNNAGVTSISAGTDTAVTGSTGAITVFSTATLQSVTNRGATTNNVTYFTNASSSSNSISGNALQVPNGGIGAGTIYATGNVYAQGLQVATISYVTTNTVANIQQGQGIAVTANTGSVTVSNTGVIAVQAGTDISISGTGSYPGAGTVTVTNTANLQTVTRRGATTPYTVSITSSSNAVSTNSGALQVTGGVGVGQDVWVGGNVYATQSVLIGSAAVAASTLGASTNSNAVITVDSYPALTYRTAKYIVQVVDSGFTPSKVHVEEIMVFHDNNGLITIPYIIQYGLGYNTTELGTWNAVYSGGNILLQFTPSYTPTNMVVNAQRIALST